MAEKRNSVSCDCRRSPGEDAGRGTFTLAGAGPSFHPGQPAFADPGTVQSENPMSCLKLALTRIYGRFYCYFQLRTFLQSFMENIKASGNQIG